MNVESQVFNVVLRHLRLLTTVIVCGDCTSETMCLNNCTKTGNQTGGRKETKEEYKVITKFQLKYL